MKKSLFEIIFLLKRNSAGFTAVELIIVIFITIVLVSATIPIYGSLQVKAQLNETSAQLVQNLRWARENSIAGYNNSAYGVFLNITSNPNFYTVYEGNSYLSRNILSDRVNVLDNNILIKNISLGLNVDNIDINFSAGLGKPNNTGSFNLVHNINGTSTISINSLGKVEEQYD